MKRLLVLVSGVVAALSVPAAALAENMSSSPSDGTNAQEAVASGGVLAAGNGTGGTLPFTGLNLVLIVVVGLALVATGVLLRRRSRDRRS